MAIQKVNTSFGASLRGDSTKIIRNAIKNGLDNEGVKKALGIINQACPKKEDRVYLYYRDMRKIGFSLDEYAGIRSGIKVAKDGKVLEKNLDPRDINPKYLLYKFALTVRDLVTGKIQPDETIKLYK